MRKFTAWLAVILLVSAHPVSAANYSQVIAGYFAAAAGPDETRPTVTSASIAANGTTVTVNFSEDVLVDGVYTTGDFTVDCSGGTGPSDLTYVSGHNSSTVLFTAADTFQSSDTSCTLSYTGETVVASCDGTQSLLAGDTETFENSSGDGYFCTSEMSVSDADGIVNTYSTNAGTLINTHSLEIDDDTAGGHEDSYVTIDLGAGQDNDWSIRFNWKIESGPDSFSSLYFIVMNDDALPTSNNLNRLYFGGNSGTGGAGPFRTRMYTNNTYDDFIGTTAVAGTTYCVYIDVNTYASGADSSTITMYDSDCSTTSLTSPTSTFQISNSTIRYIHFGGVSSDTDDHHYGIDNIEFNAAGGAF